MNTYSGNTSFGSVMEGRYYEADSFGYRFSFNYQEKDNEIYGKGNTTSALFWEYDGRIGKRWNLDPVPQIHISDYAVLNNNPINNIDILGDDWFKYQAKGEKEATWHWQKGHKAKYIDVNGKKATSKNGYRYLLLYNYNGTYTLGNSPRGTLVLYDQNKIVKESTAFSGGGYFGGFEPAGAQDYYMNLSKKTVMPKVNRVADKSNTNPPPNYNMQKIEPGTTINYPDGTKRDVNSDYGNYRIRLIPTSGRDRGLYFHGKNSYWTARTHGCVCEKDQDILEYIWNTKEMNMKMPFAVGQKYVKPN
jgi:hypothetical protein